MDAIRTSHTIGQSLRNASIAAGLLTDRYCYAEMLGQFYVATVALEERMDELLSEERKENDKDIDDAAPLLVEKVNALGYSFRSGYESDLQSLLGTNWKETIESWTSDPARTYVRKLKSATDAQCAAAAFILHGPLVIGGGAALKPRVEKSFGKDVTNVFRPVVGGGRAGRRKEFVDCYDGLLEGRRDDDDERKVLFVEIVRNVGEFMDLNNEMMMAVRQSPWWHKYVKVSVVVVVSYLLQRQFAKQSVKVQAK